MTPDDLYRHLRYTTRVLEDAGIWHTLTYGSLLGAVRDGDVISWDDDFDLVARPRDVPRILALDARVRGDGYALVEKRLPGRVLALRTRPIHSFAPGIIQVLHHGERVGDLFLFTLFRDGVLRRYDPAERVYWCPRTAYPHYFERDVRVVSMRGEHFAAPAHAEQFLAGVYGHDWRVPYRAEKNGGAAKPGTTLYGDRYEPKLHDELAWCEARGWDRAAYAEPEARLPAWPQPIDGAGPVGPTPRTASNSRSLWWRDLDELMALY